MSKKILVPLDGGEFADGILQVVAPFMSSGSQTELFRVYQDEGEREAASAHIEGRAQQLRASGTVATCALQQGDPAAEILERIELVKPDLVAMASHGRIGPWRWVRGSVAERVLRYCSTPLLIAQPSGAEGCLRWL